MYMNVIFAVLIGLIVILLIYILINYLVEKSTQLATMTSGKKEQVIKADDLQDPPNSNKFTYSLWINVSDWNYKYGQEKMLISRQGPCPDIYLSPLNNDLNIKMNIYSLETLEEEPTLAHLCVVKNIALQKWVNIIVSLYGRTLDVYIDGKLTKTCLLEGVPKVNSKSDVKICPNGGFNGWISNFQYWPDASNPQQAWNIYKGGYGGSILGGFFNKYRVKVSFLDNNEETASFEI